MMVTKTTATKWALNLCAALLVVFFMFVIRFVAIKINDAYNTVNRTNKESLLLVEKDILKTDEKILSHICSTLLTTSSKDLYNKDVLLRVNAFLAERNEYVLTYNLLFSVCFPDSTSPYAELSFTELPWENSIFSVDIRRSRRLRLISANG